MEGMRDRLAKTFGLVLNLNDETQASHASMETIPSWDSMAHINLILAVEQEFRVSLTPEEAALATSFAEMAKLVEERWPAPRPGAE